MVWTRERPSSSELQRRFQAALSHEFGPDALGLGPVESQSVVSEITGLGVAIVAEHLEAWLRKYAGDFPSDPPPTPEPDAEMALRFLRRLHARGPWDLHAFDGVSHSDARFGPDSERACAEWILETNRNANVSCIVNELGPLGVRDVRRILAFHVELLPHAGKPEGRESARILNDVVFARPAGIPAPTILVHNGYDAHALWLLDDPVAIGDPERAGEMQRRVQKLARDLDGTGREFDCRVPLPGTTSRPVVKTPRSYPPAANRVVLFGERRYSPDDFELRPTAELPSIGDRRQEVRAAPSVVSTPYRESPASISDAAREFLRIGWAPVPLKPNEKRPRDNGWPNQIYAPESFAANDNIGVHLGPISEHLLDLDFDWPEARQLAMEMPSFRGLPGFGRESVGIGHRLVRCLDVPPDVGNLLAFKFMGRAVSNARALLGNGTCVLELRVGPGQQTMFPPSRHPEGEDVRWERGVPENVPAVPFKELIFSARLLLLLSLVLRCYPREAGSRDDLCMAFAGALLNLGLSVEETDHWVVRVAELAGDEDCDDRRKAQQTFEKQKSGDPTTGLTALLEHLGLAPLKGTIFKWLALDAEPGGGVAGPLPAGAIDVSNVNVHVTIEALEKVFHEHSGVYRRQNQLVRIRTLSEAVELFDAKGDSAIHRHAGVVEVAEAGTAWLLLELSRSGVPVVTVKPQSGKWVEVKTEHARDRIRTLKETAERTNFPQLRGLTTTPTLQRDEPGYDSRSQLFLAYAPGEFPEVPMEPTRDAAFAALVRLEASYRGFPFASPADRSIALGAQLLAPIRGELGPCPMHGFDAPMAGSGKTKLGQIVGVTATGTDPSMISYTGDRDEMEKRLATLLFSGDQVIMLDNISVPVRGDFLCMALTGDEIQSRLLGKSEMLRFQTRVTMLATGNNLTMAGDMTRRALVSRIVPTDEQPEERSFDFDPVEDVRARRPQVVADVLTILRAYRAAQPVALPPLGGFESYELVRGALVWLDRPDPVEVLDRTRQEDPERDDKRFILSEVLRAMGADRWFGVRDLSPATRQILAAASGKDEFSAGSFGWRLKRYRDAPLDGLVVRRRDGGGRAEWKLEVVNREAFEQRWKQRADEDESSF